MASGQKAGRHRKAQPHVRIWSTETLLTLYVFGMTEFQMGVSALAFSQLVKYQIRVWPRLRGQRGAELME